MASLTFSKNLGMLPGVALALVLIHPAHAADAAAVELAKTVSQATAETDEVIISGGLSQLSVVRKAILDAESQIYSRFNELNKSRAFDINCLVEAPIGTRLKRRQCDPDYVSEGLRYELMYGLRNISAGANLVFTTKNRVRMTRFPEFQKRMREIALSDPQMQRALVERALLTERFEDLRKKKLDGHLMVWD